MQSISCVWIHSVRYFEIFLFQIFFLGAVAKLGATIATYPFLVVKVNPHLLRVSMSNLPFFSFFFYSCTYHVLEFFLLYM